MRFAIMARILSYDASGMHTLLMGLLRGIAETDSQHEIILLMDPGQALPETLDSHRFNVIPVSPSTESTLAKFWWDHVAVGRACKHLGVNALYAPAHVRPAYVPCPVTVSVFDMMYHRFPHYWKRSDQLYFRVAVSTFTSRATNIAALSKNTKREILSYLSIPEEIVQVVYPGVPHGFEPLPAQETETVRVKYELPNPFILFVGGFHPRKNLIGLLDAFEDVAGQLPHDLVIIGAQRWSSKAVLHRIQESTVAKRIRFLGLVPRPDLPLLYNEADLFVFPSLYEGFGFPVLEALACGCPTITSSVSSLSEVAGDAAVLVPPGNVNGLSRAIVQVLTHTELRTALRERALQQAERFSWDITAKKTIKLLEDAAAQACNR